MFDLNNRIGWLWLHATCLCSAWRWHAVTLPVKTSLENVGPCHYHHFETSLAATLPALDLILGIGVGKVKGVGITVRNVRASMRKAGCIEMGTAWLEAVEHLGRFVGKALRRR
jgi:hypothetical protein